MPLTKWTRVYAQMKNLNTTHIRFYVCSKLEETVQYETNIMWVVPHYTTV